ncbi:uncharacterized protein KY384_003556 [Bacidia gigantensis]|uniref:uncharacterized protein n=1 Tax=Bacidia gigantensis TaxID=2732470 RepID=UPI001D044E8F|nr:uncharacterized protein KY384_003556 [Bacidia gigantensis]KAG8531920.1 hypothetical protein KY384_003556 [Bacidia gigantensis]
MDGALQNHQNRVLEVLYEKLQRAFTTLERATDSTGSAKADNSGVKVNKLKFAVFMESHLSKTVEDLEMWHATFDPSWWIITRISNRKIDQQLTSGASQSLQKLKELRHAMEDGSDATQMEKKSIFLSKDVTFDKRASISHSSSYSAQTPGSPAWTIIDQIRFKNPDKPLTSTKDVRDLARILAKVDPSIFGLLCCEGVIKAQDASEKVIGFDFVFTVPSHYRDPRSLRDILTSPTSDVPLNERFALGSQLARSVFFIHASSFVHKNIRPETIIVFKEGLSRLGRPFLVGFERFRVDSARTFRSGDDLWWRNIYRHPERQGLMPEKDYSMQHDIYSLGVVLLEVGLGTSFVKSTRDEQGNASSSPDYDSGVVGSMKSESHGWANSLKKHFVEQAESKLPAIMGRKYTQVVMSCLTCLDKDNEAFGDESELEDEDGILVGVRFIEKILMQLDEISV